MHDKTIRRRRAVLALLVLLSLILLTGYFGGASARPLRAVQRGVVGVLSPLQNGASRVLSPVRDVAGFFSSLVKAKSQVAQLTAEDRALRQQIARGQYEQAGYERDQRLLRLDNVERLRRYGLVAADVIGYDPSQWYLTITIDRGTSAGVRTGDPVVGGGGLVGEIEMAGSDDSVVALLTSPKFAAGAIVEDSRQDAGVIEPAVGAHGALVLGGPLPTTAPISTGQEVVTSGFVDPHDPQDRSIFPPGILIGTVSSQNPQSALLTSQSVDVTPAADLMHLSAVQVLTRPHG